MASSFGWDAIQPMPRLPGLQSGGDNFSSDPITVPRGSMTVSFHMPVLAGAATWKLQALDPQGSDKVSTYTWRDIQIFNLASGGIQPLATVPSGSRVTTFPISAMGAGVIRVVASADQSGAPLNFTVTFARF